MDKYMHADRRYSLAHEMDIEDLHQDFPEYEYERQYPLDSKVIMSGVPDFSEEFAKPFFNESDSELNPNTTQAMTWPAMGAVYVDFEASISRCQYASKFRSKVDELWSDSKDKEGAASLPLKPTQESSPNNETNTIEGAENEESKSPATHKAARIGERPSEECSDETYKDHHSGLAPKKKKKRSQVFKRWGREEDKELFEQIRKLEEMGVLSFSQILQMDSSLDIIYSKEIKLLAQRIKWRGYLPQLIIRIQNLCEEQSFSVREVKLLKRLSKPQIKDGYIDFKYLQSEFPGKTEDSIKDRLYSIYRKTLVNICKSGSFEEGSNLVEFFNTQVLKAHNFLKESKNVKAGKLSKKTQKLKDLN